MQRAQQCKINPGRLLATAVCSLGLLLLAGTLQANEGIEIRQADTRLEAGVWFLDADIDYHLNETAREALDSGLELDIELTIRLTQRRRVIWNAQFAELKQLYTLQYHALTERYILRNLNSGEQATFGNLTVALNALGSVRGLPIIDDALLSRGERYYVAIRAVVDIEDFGGPLAIIRFLWNDWRISSDWLRWRLVP
ncbi:MAG: DUF4390 domain-containing protein [Gammaproteobacteria bacterium]